MTSDDLASYLKLFVDNSSLFSMLENIKSANNLNNDIVKRSTWT